MGDDDEVVTESFPTFKFDPFDLLVFGVQLVADVLESVSETANDLRTCVTAHANWRRDRTNMSASVVKDIEAL